jgi:hypothetical protein
MADEELSTLIEKALAGVVGEEIVNAILLFQLNSGEYGFAFWPKDQKYTDLGILVAQAGLPIVDRGLREEVSNDGTGYHKTG